ncbi:MAG: DUF1428 domain-containing protein [Beijerinckiaceae bacterium]
MAQGYLDCFVIPVPAGKIGEYRKLAEKSNEVWRKHGALDYSEWIADDVKPGKLTSFPQALQLQEGEIAVVGFARYESREHRDKVFAAVMADPFMQEMNPKTMPFDAMRMFWGGFSALAGG